MNMYVTYILYKNKQEVFKATNTACFASTFRDERPWDTMELLIKISKKTEEYKEFWLDLMKKIETKLEYFERDGQTWVKVPYLGTRGKTLFILTIIRYLWESNNYYDRIVPMTKKIIDKHPEIDPLTAIVLANSCTKSCAGWGHSVVRSFAEAFPRVWHYRRFKDDKCHKLCHPSGSYAAHKQKEKLIKIRKEKQDELDVEPILNYAHAKHIKL